MPELSRVFFDGNNGWWEGGYELIFNQSRLDLAALGERCREGERVRLYMTGEFEVDAYLHFCEGIWKGLPITGTISYIDGSGPSP